MSDEAHLDPVEAKRRSRGYSTDMSPEAIGRRLRIASDLRDACVILMRAGKEPAPDVHPTAAPRAPGSTDESQG